MTGVLCASSLVQWGQCSPALQECLKPHGGGEHSWLVHYEGAPPPKETTPQHLQHPWIREASVPGPGDVTLWHEETGEDGVVQARGPGEPFARDVNEIAEATRTRRWVLKKQLLLPFQLHDTRVGVYGMDSDGNESHAGPYWHFTAELLGDYVGNSSSEPYGGTVGDTDGALRGLHHLARHRAHEVRQSQLDVLEVFHAGAFSSMAQQNGLKVLPDYAMFSEARGWNGLEKGQRQQLRKAALNMRPRLIVMKLPRKEAPSRAHQVGHSAQGALAIELAKGQALRGESLPLEAEVNAPVWELSGAKDLARSQETSVLLDAGGNRYLTNDTGVARALHAASQKDQPRAPSPSFSATSSLASSSTVVPSSLAYRIAEARRDTFNDSEELARTFSERGDFSHQACRRLLRRIPWKELPIGKNGTGPPPLLSKGEVP